MESSADPRNQQSGDTLTSGATVPVRAFAARTFQDGELVAGRFRIERFIGQGGMGEVYEATDLELQERVALKTIRAGTPGEDSALERFKREIQLSRRVTHPNVCRVFDIARHLRPQGGEITFLTMELLAGETLADRLRSTGRLTAAEALPLALEMASGLAAAHEAGVIHRDLKSANIMLVPCSGGCRAVITDFGVAHSTDDATGARSLVGTPGYMAPEQLAGARATAATDIYAFGVVLYEMITGVRPFTEMSSITERLTAPPPSPRRVLPDVDPCWESVILRSMEVEPLRRFPNAGAVAEALRGGAVETHDANAGPDRRSGERRRRRPRRRTVAAAGLLWAIVPAAIALRGTLFHPAQPLPAERHIAVLPFKNIGGDAAGQTFVDGLAETLAGRLSELQGLQKSLWVVPASESRGLADAGAARKALGVTLVIEGSYRRAGDTARLTVNLVDAGTRRLLESSTLKAPAADLGSLEERASERVTDMLELRLAPKAPVTQNAEAEQLYREARESAATDRDRAIALFEKSIEKDPKFAAAHAGLGEVFARKFEATQDPRWAAKCRQHALAACGLEDTVPVHLAAGEALYRSRQYEDAADEFQRAAGMSPGNPEPYLDLGRTFQALNETSKAEEAFRTAIHLRPDYPLGYAALGSLYLADGRFAQAEEAYRKLVALAPANPEGNAGLAACSRKSR